MSNPSIPPLTFNMIPGSRVRLNNMPIGENGIKFTCGTPGNGRTDIIRAIPGQTIGAVMYSGAREFGLAGPGAVGIYKVDVICKK